jgi:hypothetical protein
MRGRRGRLAAGAALAGLLLGSASGGPARAQSCEKPHYLAYAEFTADDAPPHVASKQAYNVAVERYNQAVYEYCLTWRRHSQLVELHNRSASPVERDRTRTEAGPLRARLETLRREVARLAAQVDQAKRQAAEAGTTLAP